PWAFLPPPIALAVLIAGLRRGRQRIRLLTDGLVAEATLKTSQSTSGSSDPEPFPEFRRHWESTRTPGRRWESCLRTAIFAIGLIVSVALFAGVAFSDTPMKVNYQVVSRAFAIKFTVSFIAGWVGIWSLDRSPKLVTLRCTYEFRLPDGA